MGVHRWPSTNETLSSHAQPMANEYSPHVMDLFDQLEEDIHFHRRDLCELLSLVQNLVWNETQNNWCKNAQTAEQNAPNKSCLRSI